jgi:hypothetical protein
MRKAREPGRNNACDGNLNNSQGLGVIPHLRSAARLRRLRSSKAQSEPKPAKSEKVPEFAKKFRLALNTSHFVQAARPYVRMCRSLAVSSTTQRHLSDQTCFATASFNALWWAFSA